MQEKSKANQTELFIPWKEAPVKATQENPYREGPALDRKGRVTGKAPEYDGDDETKKRAVLDYYDLCRMAPVARKHPKIVRWLMKFLKLDDVNS